MSFKSGKSRDSLLDAVDACRAAHDETARVLQKTQDMLVELNDKMDRLMTHLDVPPKPPAGFVKE